MNRAFRRRAALFHQDVDCALFIDTLANLPPRFGLRIHGYALMPNHYRLRVEVPRGNLSKAMRHLGQVFTQTYNRHHGFDGPLFRGRLKNRLAQDGVFWLHLLAYLHRLWNSYNAYSGIRLADNRRAPDALWFHRRPRGLPGRPAEEAARPTRRVRRRQTLDAHGPGTQTWCLAREATHHGGSPRGCREDSRGRGQSGAPSYPRSKAECRVLVCGVVAGQLDGAVPPRRREAARCCEAQGDTDLEAPGGPWEGRRGDSESDARACRFTVVGCESHWTSTSLTSDP